MLSKENYRGVIAYPPTPFTPSLELDEEAVRGNIRKLLNAGAEGISMAGTSGEFYTMSEAELRRIAEIMSEETRRAGAVSLMGAISLSESEIIARGRLAMEAGVDASLVIAPYHTPLTDDELFQFWKRVSEACPDISLLIYHYGWVRQPYSLEMFKRLAELPNVIGSKEAHWDFKKWKSLHEKSPLLHMSSTDIGWLTELHRNGAIGVGSVHMPWMPHKMREILDLCAQGKYVEAEQAQCNFTEFPSRLKLGQGQPHIFPPELEAITQYSPLARHKAVIDALGFLKVGPVRNPAIPVPTNLIQRIRDYAEEHYPELIPPTGYGTERSANHQPLWRPVQEPALA